MSTVFVLHSFFRLIDSSHVGRKLYIISYGHFFLMKSIRKKALKLHFKNILFSAFLELFLGEVAPVSMINKSLVVQNWLNYMNLPGCHVSVFHYRYYHFVTKQLIIQCQHIDKPLPTHRQINAKKTNLVIAK